MAPVDIPVLQLLGPSTGGIRAHVVELACRLRERGWEVAVAAPAGVVDGEERAGEVHHVPVGWHPRRVVAARRRLRTLVAPAAGREWIVHAHGLKAGFVALAVRPRVRVVLTVHNLVAGTRGRWGAAALRRLETAVLRRADHVVVISDEIAERLRGVVPADRQTFVLPVSPVREARRPRDAVRAELGVDASAPLVTVVARHHPQKDLPTFLRAMAAVRDEVPAVRAVMVGDGPQRAELERLRDELGLAGVVVVAGHRPDPADQMRAADVVALSSRWEGSPLVVAEALSLGVPLVTTAVGTVTRHLVDGESALVVPIGDHRRLAAALVELLRDPARAAAIGGAGHEVAARIFAPDALVAPIEGIYRRLG